MTLGHGMQHWRLGPNKVCSNDDLDIFKASSNLLPYAFKWENIDSLRKYVNE